MDGTYAYIYDSGTAPAEQVSLAGGTITYLVTDSLAVGTRHGEFVWCPDWYHQRAGSCF
jgi:hypothetical protein